MPLAVSYSGGNYTALSVPPGTPDALGPLSANGINNSGDITGAYRWGQPPPFVPNTSAYILSGNTLTRVPGAGFPTSMFGLGINNADTIAGVLSGPLPSIAEVAFTFSNGVLQFLAPGPPPPPLDSFIAAYGINDSNHVVGSISFPGSNFGFVCAAHVPTGALCDDLTVIAYPGAGTTTVPHGINNAGDIVGTYLLNGVSHGFIDMGGMFQTLDDPAATGGTIAWGINNLDQVVGEYNDATGTHGFLATAIAGVSEPALGPLARHGARRSGRSSPSESLGKVCTAAAAVARDVSVKRRSGMLCRLTANQHLCFWPRPNLQRAA